MHTLNYDVALLSLFSLVDVFFVLIPMLADSIVKML